MRFYKRNGIKYYSLGFRYQQTFKDPDGRQKSIRDFCIQLAEKIFNEEPLVYFDAASFNMW